MLINSRNLFTSLFLVFSLGCASTVKDVSSTIQGKKSNAEVTNLTLLPIGFPDDSALLDVMHECIMLEKVRSSAMSSSSKFNLAIKNQIINEPIDINGFNLKIDFIDVIPHRWRFPSVRPSSTATFTLTINKNGKAIGSTEQSISSGVSFGACDRLEKISIAAGRYAVRWASTQI